MNTSTNPKDVLYYNEHVAGGWTDPESVARRICTALWHATEAFKRIESYEADIVLDYVALLDVITKLEPGGSFGFVYSVGRLGTHLAFIAPGTSYGHTASYVQAIREDDRGGNSAHFSGTVIRSDYETGEYGHQYGGDKYGLAIEAIDPDTAAL